MNDTPPNSPSSLVKSKPASPAVHFNKDAAPKDRLVVVEKVYHQSAIGFGPTSVDNQFERYLTSAEQPYGPRFITVGPDWQPLDLGWLTDKPIGLIVVSNEEGKQFRVNPTPTERAEVMARVVEVTAGDPDRAPIFPWLIRPTESFRGEPMFDSLVCLRCRSRSARCAVTIFPG